MYDDSIIDLGMKAIPLFADRGQAPDYWRALIDDFILDEELLRRIVDRLDEDRFTEAATPFFQFFASRLSELIAEKKNDGVYMPFCKNPLSNLFGLLAEDFFDLGEMLWIARTCEFQRLVTTEHVHAFYRSLSLLSRRALLRRDMIRNSRGVALDRYGRETYLGELEQPAESNRVRQHVACLDVGCTLAIRFACHDSRSARLLTISTYLLRECLRRFGDVGMENLEVEGASCTAPIPPLGRKVCCYCEHVSFERLNTCLACLRSNWWYG